MTRPRNNSKRRREVKILKKVLQDVVKRDQLEAQLRRERARHLPFRRMVRRKQERYG